MLPASVVVTQLNIKKAKESIRQFAQKFKQFIVTLWFKMYHKSQRNGNVFLKILLFDFLLQASTSTICCAPLLKTCLHLINSITKPAFKGNGGNQTRWAWPKYEEGAYRTHKEGA